MIYYYDAGYCWRTTALDRGPVERKTVPLGKGNGGGKYAHRP